MALAFFEQQIDDVHVQLQRLRQADAIGRRRTRNRLADPQGDALTDRNDLRDRSFTVQYRNRFAIPNGAEVLTQAGFQLRNPNGPHRSIVTRNSQCQRSLSRTTLAWLYTLFNESSDQCTTGAQPALSLRLGPKIQTLLSREGRRTSGCRTGQSRSRSGCSIVRDGHVGSHTSTKAPDAPALEGDHFSRLCPSHADATQGRWQLSEADRRY